MEGKYFQDFEGVKECEEFKCIDADSSRFTTNKIYKVVKVNKGYLQLLDNNNSSCTETASKFIRLSEQKVDDGKSSGLGLRYNKGKPMVELLVPEAMLEEAKVWTFGAKKYTPNQWKKGLKITSILACILRHTFKIMQGQDIDEESGCMHAAHIKANASMLIYFYKTDRYEELDDRGSNE